MKKMEWFFCCKSVFRFLAYLGLIFVTLGFFSCAGSPESTSSRRGTDVTTTVTPIEENKLGPLQIFYVDTITMVFKEAVAQLFTYPGEELAGLEISIDNNNTYRQLWDDDALKLIADAVSRFGVAEIDSRYGTEDTRSFTYYGTIEGNTEWLNQNRDPLTVDVRIDLGYVVKDRKTYFLITQRDTQVAEDNPQRTARITFCMGMDQVRQMMRLLNIRLYEKPLMVFLGDGVTAGTSATITGEDDPASAFPAVLQDMMTINILNAGVAWAQSYQVLDQAEDILKYDPDIVVINVGLSDFVARIDPSETSRNLQAIIDAFRSNNRKIFLVRFYDDFILSTLLNSWEITDMERTSLTNTYNGMFRNLSMINNNVELITGIWDGLQYGDTISEDYLHPTKEGYKIMAGNFYNSLKEYLGQQNYLK